MRYRPECWHFTLGCHLDPYPDRRGGVTTARLRDFGEKWGRALDGLVAGPVRRCLEGAAITDAPPAHIAATQEKRAGELTDLAP